MSATPLESLLSPELADLLAPEETEVENSSVEKFRCIASSAYILERAYQLRYTNHDHIPLFTNIAKREQSTGDAFRSLKAIHTAIRGASATEDEVSLETVFPSRRLLQLGLTECLQDFHTIQEILDTKEGALLSAEILVDIDDEENKRYKAIVDGPNCVQSGYYEGCIEENEVFVAELQSYIAGEGQLKKPDCLHQWQENLSDGIKVLQADFDEILKQPSEEEEVVLKQLYEALRMDFSGKSTGARSRKRSQSRGSRGSSNSERSSRSGQSKSKITKLASLRPRPVRRGSRLAREWNADHPGSSHREPRDAEVDELADRLQDL